MRSYFDLIVKLLREISPTPSQQLAAASLAFHRARRKFTEYTPESWYKNSECIQANNKTEAATRLRATGCCCGQNCEAIENKFHHEKSGCDALRDFVKIASNEKYPDALIRENAGVNELEEFKDAQDRFDASSDINESRQIYKKNCSCFHRISHKKCGDGDTINQSHNPESPEIDDRKNDDESLDFTRKLCEWERRSREESLMKMQRFYQLRRNRMKQEQKCQSLHKHSHCCQMHHCSKGSVKPMKMQETRNSWDYSSKYQGQKLVNVRKCDFERECNGKLHLALNNPGMHSVPEESENEDEESVKNVRQIKHRDSVDILVEKLKSKRIQEDKIDEVEELCSGMSETVSCNGIQDQVVLNGGVKESDKCEDNGDSETCCSREKLSTKELRFNKLADRLKHKSRRSRVKKSIVCYADESTIST